MTTQEVKFRDGADTTADWVNGKLHIWFRGDAGPVVADPNDMPQIADDAKRYGLEVRFVRAMALGKGSTVAQKREAVTRLRDWYVAGGAWEMVSKRRDPLEDANVWLARAMVAVGDAANEAAAREKIAAVAAKKGIKPLEFGAKAAGGDRYRETIVRLKMAAASGSEDADEMADELKGL